MKTLSYSVSTLALLAMVFGSVSTAAAEELNCDDPQTRLEARRCAVQTFHSDMNENHEARTTVRSDFKVNRIEMRTEHKEEQQDMFAKCREMHAELKASVSDDGMVAFTDVEALVNCVSEAMSAKRDNMSEMKEMRDSTKTELRSLRSDAKQNVRTLRTNLRDSRRYMRAQRVNGTATVEVDAAADM